ncbi:hypothetical protein R1flu_016688 [Riccia fluitans]|uniref:Uncharacterized protein n=1 Tax=Riccia fluitans TaxID=41844 RepID=A0ABD1YRF2_9MARC
MNGMRRCNSRQSNDPPEERPSQCQRRATSSNYELPHDEAMERIDRLVQGEETNSRVGAIVEKILTLQSMAIQPVIPTRLPRPPTIDFEEFNKRRCLSTRNEGWFIDDLFFFSSLGREDGKLLDMCAKLVICQALKWIGRPLSLYTSITLVLLALAHMDPEEPNLKPDYQFLARVARQNQEGPMLLGDEPRNAFGDTWAQWDAERCKLVRERDQLKEDLLKAQDVLADAAKREEALQVEHKKLQEEYSQEKAAWENKNRKLEEEAQ